MAKLERLEVDDCRLEVDDCRLKMGDLRLKMGDLRLEMDIGAGVRCLNQDAELKL